MKSPVAEEPPGPFSRIEMSYWDSMRLWLTSVRPKQDIILVGIAPALEEVEEYVLDPDINIP